MEYYSAVKKITDIMKCSAKWMELENIILSEVTDPKEHTWYLLTYQWILAINYRMSALNSTDPKKFNNKESPKEDA